MNKKRDFYTTVKDRSGEAYFCPLDAAAGRSVVSEDILDDCVEASTARRYSGNLDFAD